MMLSVIIPVFNSENSLEELYLRLKDTLSHYTDYWEIIMVDDCSVDKSYNHMQSLHSQDDRVKIIRLAANAGQHHAAYSFNSLWLKNITTNAINGIRGIDDNPTCPQRLYNSIDSPGLWIIRMHVNKHALS